MFYFFVCISRNHPEQAARFYFSCQLNHDAPYKLFRFMTTKISNFQWYLIICKRRQYDVKLVALLFQRKRNISTTKHGNKNLQKKLPYRFKSSFI